MKVGDYQIEVETYPHADSFVSIAFLPGGQRIASAPWDTREAAERDVYNQALMILMPPPKFDPSRTYEQIILQRRADNLLEHCGHCPEDLPDDDVKSVMGEPTIIRAATIWQAFERRDGIWAMVRCPMDEKCPWPQDDRRRCVEVAHGQSEEECLHNFRYSEDYLMHRPTESSVGGTFRGNYPWDFSAGLAESASTGAEDDIDPKDLAPQVSNDDLAAEKLGLSIQQLKNYWWNSCAHVFNWKEFIDLVNDGELTLEGDIPVDRQIDFSRKRVSESRPFGYCECSDPGCLACHGRCDQRARTNLVRVDMNDHGGTLFCNACASDALDSGLFREDRGAYIRATTRNTRQKLRRSDRYLPPSKASFYPSDGGDPTST